uniref:Uncharacterized protein n=1 Tax=Arundo donax TaxID=35708 RepID=A0A0A8ZKE2_ARUDO
MPEACLLSISEMNLRGQLKEIIFCNGTIKAHSCPWFVRLVPLLPWPS